MYFEAGAIEPDEYEVERLIAVEVDEYTARHSATDELFRRKTQSTDRGAEINLVYPCLVDGRDIGPSVVVDISRQQTAHWRCPERLAGGKLAVALLVKHLVLRDLQIIAVEPQ